MHALSIDVIDLYKHLISVLCNPSIIIICNVSSVLQKPGDILMFLNSLDKNLLWHSMAFYGCPGVLFYCLFDFFNSPVTECILQND